MHNQNLFLFILGIGVFGILNTEMGIIGILPYMAESFQVSISEAGLLVSLFALVVAVSGPTMPLLFSRFNRKYVMLLVLGIFVAGNIATVFATDFSVVLVARVIPAFFHPVYCGLAFAVAAASVTPDKAPDAVGKVMIGTAAGMVVGVPVSNWLAVSFSLQVALLFFAGVTAMAFLATLIFVPSMPVKERMTYGEQLVVLRRGNVWLAIFAIIFMNGAVFGVFGFLADYLRSVSLVPEHRISMLLFFYGIANVIGSFYSGRLLMWNASMVIRSFPATVMVLYMLLYFGEGSIWITAVLILLWGIIGGINANVNQYLITHTVPEAKEFANGLFLTSANVGTMLGTMLSSSIISQFGMSFILFSGILFAVLSMIFLTNGLLKEVQTA